MPWDENGKYVYTGGPTVSGFLWLVTGPEGKEYYYYTSTEDYPKLPEGHHAEPQGGGLINIDTVDNATIKDGIVTVLYTVPDEDRFIDALVYIFQRMEKQQSTVS
jgi:hypothetical protein